MEFISECLDSIIAQTYPCNEIIVIDDGSTDGGVEIVKNYVASYPKIIKLYQQKNSGAFIARATGMTMVTSDYMIVMDADDCLRGDALEILNNELSHKKWDIVFYNASREAKMKKKFYHFPDEMTNKKNIDIDILKNLICTTSDLNTMWAKCIKASLIDDKEVFRYGQGIPNGQDKVHSLYFIDKAEESTFIDENLYYYRCNYSSRTNTFNVNAFSSTKRLMDITFMYAKKWYGEVLAEEKCRKYFGEACFTRAYYSLTMNKDWNKAWGYLETIMNDSIFEKYIVYYFPSKSYAKFFNALKSKNKVAINFYWRKYRIETTVKRCIKQTAERILD